MNGSYIHTARHPTPTQDSPTAQTCSIKICCRQSPIQVDQYPAKEHNRETETGKIRRLQGRNLQAALQGSILNRPYRHAETDRQHDTNGTLQYAVPARQTHSQPPHGTGGKQTARESRHSVTCQLLALRLQAAAGTRASRASCKCLPQNKPRGCPHPFLMARWHHSFRVHAQNWDPGTEHNQTLIAYKLNLPLTW